MAMLPFPSLCALPETVDPTYVDANHKDVSLFSSFGGFFEGTTDTSQDKSKVPDSSLQEKLFDGDPSTCMNWAIGGQKIAVFGIGFYGGNDAELFVDLGREVVIDSVKVYLDPLESAYRRTATLSMMRLYFSTKGASSGSGVCSKEQGLKWYGGLVTDPAPDAPDPCENGCDCQPCPEADTVWPPGSSGTTLTMTSSTTARYVTISFEGLDKLVTNRDPKLCGISYKDFFLSLCHIEILVRTCDAGYWFDSTAGKCKLCPLGHYCPGGYVFNPSSERALECPRFLFGDARGLSTSACNGPCGPGYDCSAGAVTDREAIKCTDPSKYCTQGMSYTVQDGFEAFFDENGLSVREDRCPAGTWCVGGVKQDVPAGYFSPSFGNAERLGDGQCPAGFRCPAGSSSSTANPCTSPTHFCPKGTGATAAPVITSPAHYAIVEQRTDHTVFVDEALCPVGFYCQEGVRHPCPAGVQATTAGQGSSSCDGACPAGYRCGEGGVKEKCGKGYYCEQGRIKDSKDPSEDRQACPAGRFSSSTTARSLQDCEPCDDGFASSTIAAPSESVCKLCNPASSAPPGSVECSPVLTNVTAADTPPDKTPGISADDVVTFTFDSPTDQPPVGTTERVNRVVAFDPPLPASLRGSWDDPRTLSVTLSAVADDVDRVQTRIGALTAWIRNGTVRSASGLSSAYDEEARFLVTGSWGESSQPQVFATAAAPAPPGERLVREAEGSPLQPADWLAVPLTGDRIVVAFDQPVKRLPVATAEDVDRLLLWSLRPALNYTGEWNKRTTVLTVTIREPYTLRQLPLDVVARLQPGELALRVNVSAGLTSADEASAPCDDVSALQGAWLVTPRTVAVTQHTPASLLVQWELPQLSPDAITADTLAATGQTEALSVSHTLVRWCADEACDEVAVRADTASGGGGGGGGGGEGGGHAGDGSQQDAGATGQNATAQLPTQAILPSTAHLPVRDLLRPIARVAAALASSCFTNERNMASKQQASVVRMRVGKPDRPAVGAGTAARRSRRGLSNTKPTTTARHRLARHSHTTTNRGSKEQSEASSSLRGASSATAGSNAFGDDEGDSYVHNLQQQIYLLEIEAATLRARSGMPEAGVATAASRSAVAHPSEAGHAPRPAGPGMFSSMGGGEPPKASHHAAWGAGADDAERGEEAARERLSGYEIANPFVAAARTRPAGVEDVLSQFRLRVAAIEEHCRECLASAGRREAALRKRIIALTTLTEQYRAELGRLEEVHEAERQSWEGRFKTAVRAQAKAEARAERSDQAYEQEAEASKAAAERSAQEAHEAAETIGRYEAELSRLREACAAAEARASTAERESGTAKAEASRLEEALAESNRVAEAEAARAADDAAAKARAEAAQRRAEDAAAEAEAMAARQRDRAEAMDVAKTAAEGEASKALADLEASEQRCAALRESLTAAEQSDAAAREAQAAAEAGRADTEGVLAAVEKELGMARTELNEARLAAQEAEALRVEASEREEATNSARAEAVRMRDDQTSELHRALAALDESKHREAALQDRCEALRSELADAAAQAARFDDDNTDGGMDSIAGGDDLDQKEAEESGDEGAFGGVASDAAAAAGNL